MKKYLFLLGSLFFLYSCSQNLETKIINTTQNDISFILKNHEELGYFSVPKNSYIFIPYGNSAFMDLNLFTQRLKWSYINNSTIQIIQTEPINVLIHNYTPYKIKLYTEDDFIDDVIIDCQSYIEIPIYSTSIDNIPFIIINESDNNVPLVIKKENSASIQKIIVY